MLVAVMDNHRSWVLNNEYEDVLDNLIYTDKNSLRGIILIEESCMCIFYHKEDFGFHLN